MSIYLCKRCELLNTKHFNDLKKHLNRKFPCKKNHNSMMYSNDQIIALSLIPSNTQPYINLDEIEHLKDTELLELNKNELFEELENIDKDKNKSCKYCNKEFSNKQCLKKHFIIECYYNYLLSKKESLNNINNIDINNSNNLNINNSSVNSNNITNNNININLEVKTPIPFVNDWDISKISEGDRTKIYVSEYMYKNLLEEILKNELNLNVVIDKNKKSGMVYKDDINKYIQMKSRDIVDNTMEKLNSHLNQFIKDDKTTIKDINTHARRMTNKKMIDYEKDNDIKNSVEKVICECYAERKDEAIKIAKNVVKDKPFSY